MTIFYEKKPAQIIFTIHNLNLTENKNDSSFQVEWKRGKNKGFTEKMFPQGNAVHFEKRFCFNANFFFSKDGKCKPKLLSIKVLRFKEKSILKKPKIFGKATIDLSMYQKFETALASTYTLESQHKKKATIMVATQVKFVNPKPNLNSTNDTDNSESISSINTAQLLSSDHVSSWDVSTIINPADSNLLTSQSEKIKSERQSYIKKNTESHKTLESCIADDDQRLEMMKQRKRCSSIKKKVSSVPNPTLISPSETETVKSQLNNFFSPTNPKSADQNKMKKSKKMSEMYLEYQVSLGLIKTTLNYPWCDSPVPIIYKDTKPEEQVKNSKLNDQKENTDLSKDNSKRIENQKVNKTNEEQEQNQKKKQTQDTQKKQAVKPKKKRSKDEKTVDSDDSSEEEDDEEDSSESIIENNYTNIFGRLIAYPKPSSAIFAAILHTQFLQKNVFGGVYFDSILDNFFKLIEGNKFVRDCTPVDAFTVLIHLLALLQKETIRTNESYSFNTNKKNKHNKKGKDKDNNFKGHLASTMKNYTYFEIDKDRFFLFYNRLSNITIDSFSRLCEHLVDKFAPYINQIFEPKFDPNVVIEGFSSCFKEINSKKNIENGILIIAEDYINEIIDSKLVDYLIKNPKCCTLSNTIQWNYLITSLEAEVPLCKIILFKEACSAIMMSKNISESPVECDEIAPHLPKIIVYTILKNLTSCEYMPILPDPTMFFNYYKSDIASVFLDSLYASDNYLTTSDKMTITEINEQNIVLPNEFITPKFERFEDIISTINTTNWKDVQFTEKEHDMFSFIETIFTNSSN